MNFMSGIMISSQGEKGHWYAIKKGVKLFTINEKSSLPYLTDKQGKTKLNPAGKNVWCHLATSGKLRG